MHVIPKNDARLRTHDAVLAPDGRLVQPPKPLQASSQFPPYDERCHVSPAPPHDASGFASLGVVQMRSSTSKVDEYKKEFQTASFCDVQQTR